METHFYFHHFRVGDFEIPEDLFKSTVDMITKKDSDGNQRFYLHLATDPREENVTYYYVWSQNSDFLYLGYVERIFI